MTDRKSSVIDLERTKDGVLRVHDNEIRKMSASHPDMALQNEAAKNATEAEHNLSFGDALRLYPKAIAFSVIFSSAIIMEGYDLSLMGSFFGFTPFKNKYGTEADPTNPGGNLITAPWQSGLTNGVQVRELCVPSSSYLTSLVWFYHWSVHQWLCFGQDWLQEDYAWCSDCHDRRYLRPFLRS